MNPAVATVAALSGRILTWLAAAWMLLTGGLFLYWLVASQIAFPVRMPIYPLVRMYMPLILLGAPPLGLGIWLSRLNGHRRRREHAAARLSAFD